MKRNLLRRTKICLAVGLFAALAFWAFGMGLPAPVAVIAGAAFAIASFVPLTLWPYVISNFFGKRKTDTNESVLLRPLFSERGKAFAKMRLRQHETDPFRLFASKT